MKKAGVLLAAVCAGGIVALVKSDTLREKLFNGKYENEYLKAVELARLAGDIATWPINFIKPMLP